jgi:hypothetical protein
LLALVVSAMEVVAIIAARGLRNGLLKTAGIYNLTGRPSSIPPIIFSEISSAPEQFSTGIIST